MVPTPAASWLADTASLHLQPRSPLRARLGRYQSVFFELFLEGHDLGNAAGLEHVLRALIGEVAVGEQREIGTGAGPGDAKPGLDRAFEIGHGPEGAVGRGGRGPKELARRVLMELGAHGVALVGGEFGPIPADSSIPESGDAVGTVQTAPV